MCLIISCSGPPGVPWNMDIADGLVDRLLYRLTHVVLEKRIVNWLLLITMIYIPQLYNLVPFRLVWYCQANNIDLQCSALHRIWVFTSSYLISQQRFDQLRFETS